MKVRGGCIKLATAVEVCDKARDKLKGLVDRFRQFHQCLVTGMQALVIIFDKTTRTQPKVEVEELPTNVLRLSMKMCNPNPDSESWSCSPRFVIYCMVVVRYRVKTARCFHW